MVQRVLSKEIKVKVAGGSATAAVQSLVDAGLFSSYEEFTKVCKAAGYTPEDIKATTFTFEAGCTQTDIAKKLPNRNFYLSSAIIFSSRALCSAFIIGIRLFLLLPSVSHKVYCSD